MGKRWRMVTAEAIGVGVVVALCFCAAFGWFEVAVYVLFVR